MDNNTNFNEVNSETSTNTFSGEISPAPKKKSPLGLIIGIIVAIVVFIACAIGAFAFILLSNPTAKVTKAVVATLSDSDKTASEYLQLDKLTENTANGAYQSAFHLNLDDIQSDMSADLEPILALAPSLSVETATDIQNQKASSDIDFICGGTPLVTLNCFADGTTFGIAAPDYYDGSLSFDTMTLAEDFNNSYMRSIAGTEELTEEVNQNYFETLKQQADFWTAYSTNYAEDNAALLKAMTVEKTDSADISINQKKVTAVGYLVTIPGENVRTFLDNANTLLENDYLKDSFAELESQLGTITFPENFICTIYVADGKMVRFTYNDDFTVDTESMNLDATIDWTGVAHANDEINSTINLTDTTTEESFAITCSSTVTNEDNEFRHLYGFTLKNNSYDETVGGTLTCLLNTADGTFTLDSNISDDTESVFTINMSGAFSNVADGYFTADVSDASLAIPSDNMSLTLSGDYSIQALDGEVTIPDGTLRPIFEMDETDCQDLGQEVIGNLMSSPIGSFLQ